MTWFVAVVLCATLKTSLAQDFRVLPWKYDKWLSTDGVVLRHDKLEHAVRDGLLFCGLKPLVPKRSTRFAVVAGFALCWELYDGFRWRKTDGFSSKDLIAGLVGQLAAEVVSVKIDFKRHQRRG